MTRSIGLILFLLTEAFPAPSVKAVYDIREYGARGDGVSKDTLAVQAAIDAAERHGGGTVRVSPGSYLCGSIHLKSNITIHLVSGARLLASRDEADFDPYEKLPYPSHADNETSYFHYALLTGENVSHVAVVGQGTIDGNRSQRGGPKPIALKNSAHLSIRDITIKNAPNYAISFLGCDYVNVDGVSILNGYADGIDPDCSRHVRIANCFVYSWDDAICLKTSPALGSRRSTENVTITNCVLSSSSNDLKLGTESSGDFKNIAISNCSLFHRAQEAERDLSGLAIETVDGANVDGLVVSNLSMQEIYNPIFIRLGNRGRAQRTPTPGSLENVSIVNVIATEASLATSITGIPGHPIKRINLDNIMLKMKGNDRQTRGLDVPEAISEYPESNMFGTLPAYALYVRHAEGLTLRNLQVSWTDQDWRPALLFDDVKDLELSGFKATTVEGNLPVVWLHQVVGVLVQGCRTAAPTPLFLRLTGTKSSDVRLIGNDLTSAVRAFELGPDVSKSAVLEQGNALPRPPSEP